MTLPLTVILPVKNEELNLGAALASIAFARDVYVIDSGSTDCTAEVARASGAHVVQFTYAGGVERKKNWALRTLPISTPWILILDADERITPALRDEIAVAIRTDLYDAYALDREFVFMGREVKCFRPNWNVRLFRQGAAIYEDLGLHGMEGTGDNEVHEHMVVNGRVGYLKNPMRHDDYRGLTPWIERHNRYATWEAAMRAKMLAEPVALSPLQFVRLGPIARKRALRRIWVRLPGRPALRFLVWFVFRRGYRDGQEGFVFCVLMGFYEFLISAKTLEARRGPRVGDSPPTCRPVEWELRRLG